jgi:hypothetical protein
MLAKLSAEKKGGQLPRKLKKRKRAKNAKKRSFTSFVITSKINLP